MAVAIKKCSCQHEWQDKAYGKGRRVFNKTSGGKGQQGGGWRCTVCDKVKD